jgi:Kef-type K+ transport system membrane component KefB
MPAEAAAGSDGLAQAFATLAAGGTALLLAFLSLTRPAARLARWPLASALVGGGWLALAAGLVLGPGGTGLLRNQALVELRPLTQLGLAWVGLLVGLQMRRDLVAAVPNTLWRWVITDAAVAFLAGAAVTVACLRSLTPDMELSRLWPVASLAGAACIGWSGELRSLRGLDVRAPQVAAWMQAGAGLGSALAIIASDLVTMSPRGSQGLFAVLAIAGAAALSLRTVLGPQSGQDGRLILALVATLATVAGAGAAMDASPMTGAFLLGLVVANLRGGPMRRMERLVSESEPAVAAIFFMLAGVMLGGVGGRWPWVLAGALLAARILLKPLVAWWALGTRWREPGAGKLRAGTLRQAPIAVALAVAAVQVHDTTTERGLLLTVVLVGVSSGLLPLLRGRSA